MYKDTFKMIGGDIAIENGKLILVKGQEELRQNIENRLSVNTGEWFLNLNLGLRYKDIRGKGISDIEIELAIRDCCLQDTRVKDVEIISIKRNPINRTVEIDIKIIDNTNVEQVLREVVDIG